MPYYGQRKEIKEEFKSRWGKGVIVLKKNLKKKKKPILVRINIMKKYFTLQFFNIDAVLAKADNRSPCSSGGGNTSAHMQQTSSGRPWMLHKHMRPYLHSPTCNANTNLPGGLQRGSGWSWSSANKCGNQPSASPNTFATPQTATTAPPRLHPSPHSFLLSPCRFICWLNTGRT